MVQDLSRLNESPSQTAGPYVHIGLTPNFSGITGVYDSDLGATMVEEGAEGERIIIEGSVCDGTGTQLKDAVLEIWQADAAGLYNSPTETRGTADLAFSGWGRSPTDMDSGEFRFDTIKPGRVPFGDGSLQAPHISFWIVARGINTGLHTRMYFGDEDAANSEDPLLARIEHKIRIPTLVAPRSGNTYRFDIHLQGERETVFFDI